MFNCKIIGKKLTQFPMSLLKANALLNILVTPLIDAVFHFETSELKAMAASNVEKKSLTLDTSHVERSLLKDLAL